VARANEKCGCGASIEVTADADHRVRTALEEWRTGHQHTPPATKEDPDAAKAAEHHPQGNNFATTERKGNSLEPYEMHAGWRPDSYGSISLKWHPKEES
jgi:hypothetical protein